MATANTTVSSNNFRRKKALVIGNGDYSMGKKLANTIQDANDMVSLLKSIGFSIHGDKPQLNLTYKQMRDILTDFERSIENDNMVLFYFAGHGIQWEDQNYLIPIDNFKEENGIKVKLSGSDLKQYGINAQNHLNNIDDRQPFLILFFLDCCRIYSLRNSQLKRNHREEQINYPQGLTTMAAEVGSLIAFACAPGTVADDENCQEKNSLFTKYLLKHLPTPNEDIQMILSNVTNYVQEESNGDQIPHVTSTLRYKNIYLNERKQETKFQQRGITVAGGNGHGNQLNQLKSPSGIFVDQNKTIFIVEYDNHRIVQWKFNKKQGEIIAGGNEQGKRLDQLHRPTDVIVDQSNHSIIIADQVNRRVIRWTQDQKQEILIQNISCFGLSMDQNRFLYVCNRRDDEVRKWKLDKINENKQGILVAGGYGEGDQRNQLDSPTFIFVDKDQSIYISDSLNHRVMKWKKDAREGIIVAGGNGEGNNLNQLNYPGGLFVDEWNQIYVVDSENNRIMRWCEGDRQGEIVVGGNGSNQLNGPMDLSFDLEGNLYVSDSGTDRILRFDKID